MASYRSIDRHDIADGHPIDVFDAYWDAVSAGGQPVPWRCFRPMDFPRVLPWVLLLDHIEDDTYVYRLTGSGCEQIFGRNMTGQTFGTGVKKSFITTTLKEFAALREGASPFYYHGTIPIQDRDYIEVYRAAYGFADKCGNISKMFVVVAPVSTVAAPRKMQVTPREEARLRPFKQLVR